MRIGAIAAAPLIVLALSLPAYAFFGKKIEIRGDYNYSAVTAAVPLENAVVPGRISRLFKDNKVDRSSVFSHLVIFRVTDRIFPDEFQLGYRAKKDGLLRRYVNLPGEKKRNDLYLYEPSGDYYWRSVYYWDGKPAKFRCAFIIHIEPVGKSMTGIEIFEYLPEIWAGEYFDLLGHSGPAYYHDIRFVAPTVKDRVDLLELIVNGIK